MFTGLISAIGVIEHSAPQGCDTRFTIRPTPMFSGLVVGESIAVNGACLTVEAFTATTFSAFASGETLAVTTLKAIRQGSRVNLERALALGDRLGGHLVSGHVDGCARIESITDVGNSKIIKVQVPETFAGQVIPKGSIALNGISLTINRCGPGFIEVNVIPETQRATTIMDWRSGDLLNIETDIIGKYVQNCLTVGSSASSSGLTIEFLREHGF